MALCRVLVKQPLSIEIGSGSYIADLSIQGNDCRIAVRPVHDTPTEQREHGESFIAIEFERDDDTDLVVIARDGFELIEDFLSAIALVSGFTFRPSILVQVSRMVPEMVNKSEFLQFLPLPHNRWHEPLTESTIQQASHLIAHWDGLKTGKRLRRAARQYREAAGTFDDVLAFQETYIGLEAMEPPLAKLLGLTPGSEEVTGSCQHCKAPYTRKRTTIVGVRAFVLGETDPKNADEGRKRDWKLINGLRTELMHGLSDETSLGRKPLDAFIASMHYLHDAIAITSHAPELAGERYRLARSGILYILAGTYTTESWAALPEWSEIIETSSIKWISHAMHGFVPEIRFHNLHEDMRIGFAYLAAPFSVATLEDLRNLEIETD